MMERATEETGRPAAMTLADTGYFSGPNLTECADRGLVVVIPENQPHPARPYYKDRFAYEPDTDTYRCPQGQPLRYSHTKRRTGGRVPVRVYTAPRAACRVCPAFGVCTKNAIQGRLLEVTPHDMALRAHRQWMATPAAQTAARRRKQLVEPVFGILKEQQGARRFLLRGLANVQGEWLLLAAAFNLRTLGKMWRRVPLDPPPSHFPCLSGSVA